MLKTFLIFILLCSSCAKIKIKTSKNYSLTTSKIENDTRDVKLQVTKHFYMWGLMPSQHELLLDRELLKIGVKRISSFEITETPSQNNVWMKLLSFGLFLPQTYIITGKTD